MGDIDIADDFDEDF